MTETVNWTRPALNVRKDCWAQVSQAIFKLDLACAPWPGTQCVPELITERLAEVEIALDSLRLTWGL